MTRKEYSYDEVFQKLKEVVDTLEDLSKFTDSYQIDGFGIEGRGERKIDNYRTFILKEEKLNKAELEIMNWMG